MKQLRGLCSPLPITAILHPHTHTSLSHTRTQTTYTWFPKFVNICTYMYVIEMCFYIYIYTSSQPDTYMVHKQPSKKQNSVSSFLHWNMSQQILGDIKTKKERFMIPYSNILNSKKFWKFKFNITYLVINLDLNWNEDNYSSHLSHSMCMLICFNSEILMYLIIGFCHTPSSLWEMLHNIQDIC